MLVTELRGSSGTIELTDALTLRSGAVLTEDVSAARGELLRVARVREGRVRLLVHIEPRGGAGVERRGDGWRLFCQRFPDLDLQLFTDRPLQGTRSVLELGQGDTLHLSLRWVPGARRYHPRSPDQILDETANVWKRWLAYFTYEGPRTDMVRRSAITIKLLDHFENGAIVAAPTSSLPEAIGGPRNWDYRYAWIRDAAFSVYALRRIGLAKEAWNFLAWVLDAVDRDGHPKVLYTLDAGQPHAEIVDDDLEGYRRSPPVRWGNAAADQRQHDVFGEILDCAYQWAAGGGSIEHLLWQRLSRLIEDARVEWNKPDPGIWEVRRSAGRVFTYSAALCQVALDRGVRLAAKLNLPGDTATWQADANRIQQAIINEAWDEKMQSFTEHVGAGGGLDASLLTLPLRRLVPADHPRMVATTQRVVENLGAGDGLIYRYLNDVSPDGIEGHEGAFLLCSFWLVDNLALQGRLDEALDLYDSLCARANPLGLMAEEIDPSNGTFLGNFPQAFSHVGLISSGVTLARALKRREDRQ